MVKDKGQLSSLFKHYAQLDGKTPPWIVFTGAPSSGKTTIANGLKKLGYMVIPDVSRMVVEDLITDNTNIKEISAQELSENILDRIVLVENSLCQTDRLILDRALPDSIAFRTLKKQSIGFINDLPMFNRYRAVFLFESVSFFQDGYRDDNESDKQDEITYLIEKAYKSLKYEIQWIPRMPIPDRVRFVTEKIRLLNV